ncbi:cytochrome P450 [Gymnopus androsaceus JB14]|uniref:Cytochrome P450 n=1 Tax=Gymnopus androsaceus JB14 TaxID=1447944 RepID=A0A6A4HSU8_9AGAR|nr:cytochrome P450 [Gymnopus androsaceus JB14]
MRRLSLPPGPKGWPIIGNIFDIPKEKAHIAYMEMGRKYGSDFLYLNMAGTSLFDSQLRRRQRMIFSLEGPRCILIAPPLSDAFRLVRPRLPMLCELMGWDFNLRHFYPYGTRMASLKSTSFFFLGETSSLQCTAFPSTIPNDPYLELARKALHAFAEAGIPGTYLVDAFPMLKNIPGWLPGSGFKKKAAYERNVLEAMIKQPFEFVKKNMESGTTKTSIASRALQQMQDDKNWSREKEDLLQNILTAIYAGGADTTAAVIGTVFLALVRDIDILKKGQAAVDAVVGADRLPSFNDERKILREKFLMSMHCYRRTVQPVRISTYIPVNTVVLGNSWAILHDPTTYGEDVDQFRPERFLNSDGTLNNMIPYPDVAFGFGRRVCPGKALAQSLVWLSVASLLSCFNLDKVLDKDGVEVEPSTDYINGLISYPRPYECIITPRSKLVEEMIRQTSEK